MRLVTTICFFFYGLLIFSCLRGIATSLSDPDTLWHIAAGDEIRRLGSIPLHDLWSFTAGDYPWLNIAWLFDVLLSWAHQHGGLPGIARLTIMLMALHSTLLFYAAWRYSRHLILSLAIAVLSAWCLFPGMLARPQWITYSFGLLFMLILRFRPQAAWLALPALMVVWVNVHGGFFIGLLVIAAHGIEALWQKDVARVKRLLATGLLCALATLATPLGLHMADAVLRTMHGPINAYIVEWQPLRLEMAPLATFYILLFVGLSSWRHRSVPLAERLLALACFFMALQSTRMLQVAVSLAVPAFVLGVKEALASTRLAPVLERKNAEYLSDFASRKAHAFALLFALSATAFLWSPMPQRLLPDKSLALPEMIAPAAEVSFILEHYPHIRFLNHYDFGGYLIYATRGKLPVFIDGRAPTAYPPALIEDYLSVFYPSPAEAMPALETLLRHYRIGGLLTHKDDLFDRLLSQNPRWHKVYSGKSASVLLYQQEARQ